MTLAPSLRSVAQCEVVWVIIFCLTVLALLRHEQTDNDRLRHCCEAS